MKKLKRVYIASPLNHKDPKGIKANMKACSLYKAYASFSMDVDAQALHDTLPETLDDNIPEQRAEGIRRTSELLLTCEEIWVCGDTLSQGMWNEILLAVQNDIKVRTFSVEMKTLLESKGVPVIFVACRELAQSSLLLGGYIQWTSFDFILGEDQFWHVMACKAYRDSGSLRLDPIAVIDDLTARVVYLNPAAETDPFAQKAIREKVESLMPFEITKKQDYISFAMKTETGKLCTDFELKVMGHPYDRAYICYKPEGMIDGVGMDLARVSIKKDGDIEIMAWGDAMKEDPTHTLPILADQVKERIQFENG